MPGFNFWPSLAGVVFTIFGLIAVRKDLVAAAGWDKLLGLGRVFFAVPLAVFGAEHLAGAKLIMQIVPRWMPGRIFWTYFVGLALIAAAISILLMKHVRLSASLLAILFFLFVLMIHLPNAIANPTTRIFWAVTLRDFSFAGGALCVAGSQTEEWRVRGSNWLVTIGRVCIAIAMLVFAVEHFLHPEYALGVPLGKLTPAWIPIRVVWGYLTGCFLLAAGVCMVINRKVRTAATWLGLWITLLVLFIYVPILATARATPDITEGLNYVFDTLLFAGTILLLAAATPKDNLLQGNGA